MTGLAALDLILRRVGTRVMIVALIVEVTRVDPNDRAADAPSLRVPSDSISNFVPFSHWVFLVVQASSELRFGVRISAKADLIERLGHSRRTTLEPRTPIVIPDEQMRSAAQF
jgi:hypothetical protein